MKYLFTVLLAFTLGYILPLFATVFQAALAFLFVAAVVLCVLYFIHTRINAIRL